MDRDLAKDNEIFNCGYPNQLKYVSNLYEDSHKIETFLSLMCVSRKIFSKTYFEIYQLIEKELGFSIPQPSREPSV